jgi:hypothetical protein
LLFGAVAPRTHAQTHTHTHSPSSFSIYVHVAHAVLCCVCFGLHRIFSMCVYGFVRFGQGSNDLAGAQNHRFNRTSRACIYAYTCIEYCAHRIVCVCVWKLWKCTCSFSLVCSLYKFCQRQRHPYLE